MPIPNRPSGLAARSVGAPWTQRAVGHHVLTWHAAQLTRLSARPFAVGTHRRSGSVPSARAFTADAAKVSARRADAMTSDRDAEPDDVELLEDALAGANPVGVASASAAGSMSGLRTDRLQHLPIAGGLAPGVIHGIGAEVVDRRAVVFLFREVAGPHVEPGDRRRPVAQRLLVPRFRDGRRALGEQDERGQRRDGDSHDGKGADYDRSPLS